MENDLEWKIKNKEQLNDCRIFKLEKTTSESPKGEEKHFFRINSPDWVTIVAVSEKGSDREFVLVKQFRHGSGKISLEFPAGMIDLGESPKEAAQRELLEETGYEAEKWKLIGSVNPNPAFMTNTTFTFLAEGLKKISKQELDPDEFIKISTKSESEVASMIGEPPFDSAIMVQAYYFYQKERKA